MQNPIKRIVSFNKDAGLLNKPYDDFLESSFLIEEALEGFDLSVLGPKIGANASLDFSPKHISRLIVGQSCNPIPDVDRLDKACDAVVYAIGSMAKLGLSAQDITQALNIVMDKNLEKLKNKKYDAEGKLLKNESFVGPEAQLQLILDRIK
jgi:hypothetical protein